MYFIFIVVCFFVEVVFKFIDKVFDLIVLDMRIFVFNFRGCGFFIVSDVVCLVFLVYVMFIFSIFLLLNLVSVDCLNEVVDFFMLF